VAQNKAPYKVGDRVSILYNHSLAPGIVRAVTQGSSGAWRGDVLTEDGLLENRSLHRDYVIKESGLLAGTRDGWGPVWERLEKEAS
jgi:hypothetical protein